jgi:hypothetical protein
MMHQVDIIRIGGDEGEQALVVNGVAVDTCPGDATTCIPDTEAFFASLGRAIGVQFAVTVHAVDVEDLGLPAEEWTWQDVIARFTGAQALRRFRQDQAWTGAVEAVAEHQDAWQDGYTPEGAGEVLEALNALVKAAGLPGEVLLLWESCDECGPGGDSDLHYVENDEHGARVVPAGEIYGLVDGERDPRPFLSWLDGVRRRGDAGFVCLPSFPAVRVPGHQGLDGRDLAQQPVCCLRCREKATWLVNSNVYCDRHAQQAAEALLAEEPAVSRYHHPAGFRRAGSDYVQV